MEEDGASLQRPFGSLGGARRKELAGFAGDEEEQFCWWPCGVCWEEERVGLAASVEVNDFAGEYEVAKVVQSMSSMEGENEEEEKSSISR
ncbi:hypothetical protein HAX54_004744 [Datura stramonium]|uniref:Uncharacterized protein n=1 Tax=Datura stramonium TaxID=4076 RepID=A0ABS8T8I2_DATST|nr:hypothetical protein [Datura stramonium]